MADWKSISTNDQEGGRDKRRALRKKYITGVTYSVLATPKGTGLLQDISEMGAGIVVDQYLPAGTLVRLIFMLKKDFEDIPIEATAKVAWCVESDGSYRVGVQFIE